RQLLNAADGEDGDRERFHRGQVSFAKNEDQATAVTRPAASAASARFGGSGLSVTMSVRWASGMTISSSRTLNLPWSARKKRRSARAAMARFTQAARGSTSVTPPAVRPPAEVKARLAWKRSRKAQVSCP